MNETMPLSEIWARAFSKVQREIDVPTVWLAMQAVRPITIDGNRFVATIPPDLRYLSMNLETSDAAHAIESALESITGRPMAFLIIEGQTIQDWEAEKAELLGTGPVIAFDTDDTSYTGPEFAPEPQPAFAPQPTATPQAPEFAPQAQQQPTAFVAYQPSASEGFDTWEKLNEFIAHEQKHFPLIRFPHGQARFLLVCARMVSGTMDRLMPPPGQPSDSNHERQLAKVIERLAASLSLDPFFVSLEIMRYRQLIGRE